MQAWVLTVEEVAVGFPPSPSLGTSYLTVRIQEHWRVVEN